MTKKEQVAKSIATESVLKAKTKKKTVRFISSIIALVLLFGVIMAISAGCKGGKDETDAWVCAQYVVEGHLRSPSTADFCRYNEATITDLGNDRYRIKGYVDAQNAFGGVIRTYFTVTLTLTESGYKDAKCTFD